MSISRRHLAAGCLAGLTLADPISRALAQAAAASEPPAIIPGAALADESADVDLMTMTTKEQRLTAPVMINGQGPYDFLLDTGANKSAISTALANQLGLERGRPIRVHTMVGPIQSPSVQLASLQVGDRFQRNLNVPVMSTPGLRAAGILGVDWLKGERLSIDFLKERLEIRKPGRAQMETATIVPARLRSGQLTIIDADLNGRGRISAMIDSGSEVSIGNNLLRVLATERSPRFEEDMMEVSLIDASNRTFTGEMGFLPFVRIGGVQFGNLPVVFAQTPLLKLWGMEEQPSIMLGMDILRQFSKVEMDFSQSRVGFTVLEARRA